MKIGISLGLILLIGIGALVHRTQVRVAEPQRWGPMTRETVQGPSEETSARGAGSVVVPTLQPRPVEVSRPVAATPVPSWRKLLVTVDQSLALTETQKAVVQEMLIDRDKEIKIWHEAIRKAGLLDIRQYDWQVGLMKEAWYRRVDALLDVAQHQRFTELVAKGLFNEGLAFTVEPGMTVLD